MSKESEAYRLEVLRRLKQKDDGPPPPEVAEAERVIAKYREEQAQARDAIPRAGAPLPEADLCPRCWIDHGTRSAMIAVSGEGRDTANYDYWLCRQCRYEEPRRFR
jgi:hypothetical protein